MNLKEMAGCLGWVSAFLLFSMLVPFLGPLLGLLTPQPFFYYSTKLGRVQGAALTLVVIFIVGALGALAGAGRVVILAAEYGILGFAIARLFDKKRDLIRTVFLASGLLALTGLTALFLMAGFRGVGLADLVRDYLTAEFTATIDVYRELGVLETTGNDLDLTVKAFVDVFIRILPALMIVGTGLVVWLNALIAKLILTAKKIWREDDVKAKLWQAPEQLVWGLIVSGFAAFFLSGTARWIAVNLIIVMGTVYFFHGLCIMIFLLDKHKVPSWLRVGLYILIAVQQLFLLVLALAGLFDQWMDFRKLRKATGA